MTAMEDLRTLTVEQVAGILGVRPEAVRIWIREGAIDAMKWGRRLRIRPEAVRRFQDSRPVSAPDPIRDSARLLRRATRRTARHDRA